MEVPGFGRVLMSTDSRGPGGGGGGGGDSGDQYHPHSHVFLSLLPVGSSPCLQLTSRLGMAVGDSPSPPSLSRGLKLRLDAAQIVICLSDDDAHRSSEILRFVAGGLQFSHSSPHSGGSEEEAELELTLASLRVDNMTRRSSEEFGVALLPRLEHVASWSLAQQKPPAPLLRLSVRYNPHSRTFQISSVRLCSEPATLQLEDSLLQTLRGVARSYTLPHGVCVAADKAAQDQVSSEGAKVMSLVLPPPWVLQEAQRDLYPVSISSLVIEPFSLHISANLTLGAYLSCKDTPFSFPRYELTYVFSNWSEVSQAVAARYVSALFMHAGWVLGSLELLGSPVAFVQSVNQGLRDLVMLPYEGLTRSPTHFLLGIGRGTASFLHQFSSGALSSLTNLASSIARNMERLSMDPDHVTYQDQQRRERPATHLAGGVASGVSSFALSLMSGVAGLVEQPMQSIQKMEDSAGTTSTLLKGVGKGLLGVVTKPVGGAMDLVSKTGQGIMCGTGLVQVLRHCELAESVTSFVQAEERRGLVKTAAGYAR